MMDEQSLPIDERSPDEHCKCAHRYIIQRRDGKGESIVCKSVQSVRKHIEKIKVSDPIGVARRRYEVVEELSYYEEVKP